jgi:hypothetical protein
MSAWHIFWKLLLDWTEMRTCWKESGRIKDWIKHWRLNIFKLCFVTSGLSSWAWRMFPNLTSSYLARYSTVYFIIYCRVMLDSIYSASFASLKRVMCGWRLVETEFSPHFTKTCPDTAVDATKTVSSSTKLLTPKVPEVNAHAYCNLLRISCSAHSQRPPTRQELFSRVNTVARTLDSSPSHFNVTCESTCRVISIFY